MSKEKITKTDIKNAVARAFYDTLYEGQCRLTADQVAKAFEGSGLQYHFDPKTADITIIVDGNCRIECIRRDGRYEIRPSMTYNSLTSTLHDPKSPPLRDEFIFYSYQLPSMIGFFRNFADRLTAAKNEFDNQTKNITIGSVLKAVIRPLLRKEKIFKVKYLIGDDDGTLIMYKDFNNKLRLSVVLTADNYKSRIPEFGEVDRLMSELANRDDADTFFSYIYRIERGVDVEFVNPSVDHETYSTMRYPEDIELIEFNKHVEKPYRVSSDLCDLLDELDYNWGWIFYKSPFIGEGVYKPVVQINNDLKVVIDRCDYFNNPIYKLAFAPASDNGYDYGRFVYINRQSELFYILRILATQVPVNELAKLSFSDGLTYEITSMIANQYLTFRHSKIIYHGKICMESKNSGILMFDIDRNNLFSEFDYLNDNYDSYLNLANTIAKFQEINLECIKK